ncbi:MAG: hypothetical protein EB829_06995 [Nitrosopumilus sp. H8]|nr:MAG: hypothetical protein EB830_06510 [Nitrosopumilus sp. H13]RNJ77216.1 MAG: hypothetical protein EB829_06995 [Nitrosopumilus sp. H8]
MAIQILQYEFLGPVPLAEWGPPMEKLVYLVMSRRKDSFVMLYAGDCESTDDKEFFAKHPQFKCWVKQSGSEDGLYLAVLPMFESGADKRTGALEKIISRYKPPCNPADAPKEPPYSVRKGYPCPCCGAMMEPEKKLASSTLYRCTGCKASDTRLD